MQNLLLIIQSVLALGLVLLILIQGRGTGISRAFGGGNVSFTRRGLEKIVFKSTFVFSALFIIVSILQLAI